MTSPYLSDDYRDALEDYRERRELQGLGDSDGLGSDPTLEPPSLTERERLANWRRNGFSDARAGRPSIFSDEERGLPHRDAYHAGYAEGLRARKAENDEHSFGL